MCSEGRLLYNLQNGHRRRGLRTASNFGKGWIWIAALQLAYLTMGWTKPQTRTLMNSEKVWFWTLWLGLLFNYRSQGEEVGKCYIYSLREMAVQLKNFQRFILGGRVEKAPPSTWRAEFSPPSLPFVWHTRESNRKPPKPQLFLFFKESEKLQHLILAIKLFSSITYFYFSKSWTSSGHTCQVATTKSPVGQHSSHRDIWSFSLSLG